MSMNETGSRKALSASFIDGAAGKILLTCYGAASHNGHAVIVLPAFGEEMNKSRRLIRNTAIRLADKGYLVINPDLFGCGDSEGCIADARLSTWIDDLCAVITWAKGIDACRFSILAVRAGAMLLDGLLARQDWENVVGWQPVDGAETLRGLLRIRALNRRMSGQSTESAAEMLERLLEAGMRMDMSGYTISTELAKDMMITETAFSTGSAGFAAVRLAREAQEERVIAIGGERFWRVLEPGPNEELVTSTVGLFPNP